MPRRLAQQRMTLSDTECIKSSSSVSRAISAVAELLVLLITLNAVFIVQRMQFLPRFVVWPLRS